MKTFTKVGLVIAIGLVLGAAGGVQAQTKADASTGEIMKMKLDHAQKVLEGIATENYELILANAQKLSRLSQATGWHTRQTPEYEMFTLEFRRHADALVKAARSQNVDAASVAYFQMTISCVSCHKYIRSAKTASLR